MLPVIGHKDDCLVSLLPKRVVVAAVLVVVTVEVAVLMGEGMVGAIEGGVV